jgi:TolB-like protein
MRYLASCLVGFVMLWAGCARVFAAEPPPTVAVLYFDYTGRDPELEVLRKGLAQMLISDLSAADNVRIVERDRLEDVLAELKLQSTAKIDPKSAARVGKLLGARYLVLGGYFDLQGVLRVDARIIDVETGRVLKSIGANGKPGDFLPVEQQTAGELGQWFAANVSAPATPPAGAPPKTRPSRPATLKTKTAVRYAEALAAVDRGDKQKAKENLTKVVAEAPDFGLARLDLDRLTK